MDKTTRPKLSEIAKAANVSVSTVSKVLNGRTDVSDETRLRIEHILTQVGYQKSLVRKEESKQIEIIFNDFEDVWALELLRGVLQFATTPPRDYSVGITELKNLTHSDSWVQGVLERKPIGVILVFSSLSEDIKRQFESRNIPYLTLDPAGDPAPQTYTVRADNWTGELVATRHLLTLGHTRIGIITGPLSQLCAQARLDGYRAALAEAHISEDPELIHSGDFHVKDGFEHAVDLLTMPDRPTAIVAGNDLQAMGVYDAARHLGLCIPEDISVIGFDDISYAKHMSPALTTVKQPLSDMAERAAQILMNLYQGDTPPTSTVFSTNLIVRNSASAPPSVIKAPQGQPDPTNI